MSSAPPPTPGGSSPTTVGFIEDGVWHVTNQMTAEDAVFRKLLESICCKHCTQPFRDHSERKCLYGPTYYEPEFGTETSELNDICRDALRTIK